MKFGVREICDVVFKAKDSVRIGTKLFKKGEPVLLIDTATTSTIEGAATTVYAQGGRGNVRLLAWEGEKTLTFTVTDALLSPIGFAVLSGAGLLKPAEDKKQEVHVHTTYATSVSDSKITIPSGKVCTDAPIFVVKTDADGSLTGNMITGLTATVGTNSTVLTGSSLTDIEGQSVFVDYYVTKDAYNVTELQIDAANFAGFYYVEASTLFRRQDTGKDMPAEITFPKVKIQSNFTFTMAATGDPSTFDFTMDAFPDYTYFDKSRKVLCVIQVIEDAEDEAADIHTVMEHDTTQEVGSVEDGYTYKKDEKTLVGSDGYADSTDRSEPSSDVDMSTFKVTIGETEIAYSQFTENAYTLTVDAATPLSISTTAAASIEGLATVTTDPASTVTPVADPGADVDITFTVDEGYNAVSPLKVTVVYQA